QGALHSVGHHGAHLDNDHHAVHNLGHHEAPHHRSEAHHSAHHAKPHHTGHHNEGTYHNSNGQHGFNYAVHDDYSGAKFGHSETHDEYRVEGTYYVHLPDGRVQTVNYYADETGYHPTIVYEGTPTYH
ncbi:unnamed protein product, partial [Meganyctiphanes norvegica]